MVENGLYRVSFQTPMGQGTGVAYLHDGRLRGGDSMMAYVGSYNENAGQFTADVRVYQHSQVPGMTSAIGVNEADLHIAGTVQGGNVNGTGQAPKRQASRCRFCWTGYTTRRPRPLDNRGIGAQQRNGLRQALLGQSVEVFDGRLWRLFEPAAATLSSNDHRSIVEVILELDEVVGVSTSRL